MLSKNTSGCFNLQHPDDLYNNIRMLYKHQINIISYTNLIFKILNPYILKNKISSLSIAHIL